MLERQVEAAIRLLDEGSTVPFVARYRKEATGSLDDSQLRTLASRLGQLRELEERRASVLETIREQGQLTAELERAIREADSRTRLEDLYLPYRPKRRTKAQLAREAGLEPLARQLLEDPSRSPAERALPFVAPDRGVPDVEAALEGSRQILIERFAENADLVGRLRELYWQRAELTSTVAKAKEDEGAKFRDYFRYAESLRRIPSHRALALLRGETQKILRLGLRLPEDEQRRPGDPPVAEDLIARHGQIRDRGRPGDGWLLETARHAWRHRLEGQVERDLLARLRESAEAEAIRVFGRNLRDLLLAAPAGSRATIGLDPGLRTGVKVAVVDGTGKVLATDTVYPHPPRNEHDLAIHRLAEIARRFQVELVAIGNGTGGRETERLVIELIRRHPELGLTRAMVSEAGASVYSASELASRELPSLDVSLRGAVSIARRLQDPLAELVKIDPQAIGVGQYQHDVAPADLAEALNAVVEDCVNAVGVDVNTASPPLLARVSGLHATLAANLVTYRDAHGAFRNRRQLLAVPRLGARAFEQCAGFLRIVGGDNPLDASAVHPEAYPVVERLLTQSGRPLASIIGDSAWLKALDLGTLAFDRFGEPTVRDILAELDKPGRDPRPQFRTATFRENVETLDDLRPDMLLEGVVTNVTNFGAFVDIGVHQDGLVHISALSEQFVRDPHVVVKAGDVVRVKVLEVDRARNRIALTMRIPQG